ncbi:MAG: sodium:solute symporter [Clostridia bacterium]|nr:sodium:solute symporter [Clostridia bacterium]
MVIQIIMLIAFFGTMVAVGIYCHKNSTDVNSFVLGGRQVGPWLTAFAYGTSYFSAVVFVGYAGQFGWKYGIASTWAGIGNAFLGSLLAWIILGRRTRIMTQHLDSATMPQFFGSRYKSEGLKLLSSAVIFIFLIPYTASLYNGLSRLFGMAFNIDYSYCVLGMAVLTAIYVIAGGYMATAINDFIQGIVMIGGIIAVITAVLNTKGGFDNAMTMLAGITSESEGITAGGFTSFFGPDPVGLLGVVLLTSLGTWGLPQMVQKFYAIKSEKAITKGAVISTIFALVVAGGCYFLGGFGRLFTPEYSADGSVIYDSIIPNMLSGLSPILIGVVIILVLSASMSTLSSLVLASSSTLTLDFIKEKIAKNMPEKKQVFTMRVLIVVFIAISALIAIVQHNSKITFIAQLMGISWGALAGAFLAPFLYGLYSKSVTKAAVWVNIIFSTVVMVMNILFGQYFPTIIRSPINAGAFCMLAGLIIVPLVSAFTKKLEKEHIDDIFSCYDKKVTVDIKEHMG